MKKYYLCPDCKQYVQSKFYKFGKTEIMCELCEFSAVSEGFVFRPTKREMEWIVKVPQELRKLNELTPELKKRYGK